MEKQVEKIYTIAKFKEFQQELIALMYCDTVDSVGSIYEISESLGQGKKKNFEVVFDETECEVSCICSKFQFSGILCRHALSVLIRHGIEIFPEMYILSRWRKDVKRCYSKDLPKQIRCASVETTAIGEVSCSSNNIEHVINDPVAARRKGRPLCLRKQSSLRKKPAQKNKTAEKNKDLQENASASFEMANEVSTQQSNMAMVPVYPFQVGGNNIYQPIPYSWNTQSVPTYALQSHYSSPSMTYEGSASGNFQQLLHQQCNEDNNRRN
ncbi:hypothetical protein WN944_024582 [Citrus x changshan-huyou]|uniref:Protein FAR1-RELATED SEQUENCE n=1 Tax=Citrus x changshan-huyou TaxID=2935761 RepID=A0AAP0QCR0_9ROSI